MRSALRFWKTWPLLRAMPDTVPRPTIASASPGSVDVAGGTVVTLTGSGYRYPKRVETACWFVERVEVDGVVATGLTIIDDKHLSFIAPAHGAGAVNVRIFSQGGQNVGVGILTYASVITIQSEDGLDILDETGVALNPDP